MFQAALFVFTVFFRKINSHAYIGDDKLCSPLLPTPKKIETIALFRQDNAPILSWHPQKAGGTSICMLLRMEYNMRTEKDPNYPPRNFTAGSCSRANFIRDIILNFTTWEAVYRPFNYVFVEIEPSNANYMTFPIRYHQQRITNAFLNNSNPLHSQAWDNLVHVLVIRQPIEMSLSALTFAFPGMDRSIHATCHHHHLNSNQCMLELFRIKDNPQIIAHELFNSQQLNRIRNQILGNYSTHILAYNNDTSAAKERLHNFHLIVDLSLRTITSTLVTCVLGFANAKSIPHMMRNKAPITTTNLLEDLSPEVLSRLSYYLRHEQDLYDYALQLTLQHHRQALQELHGKSF